MSEKSCMLTMEDKIMRDCIRRRISLDTMLQISGQLHDLPSADASMFSDYLVRLLSQSQSEHEFCTMIQGMNGYYD